MVSKDASPQTPAFERSRDSDAILTPHETAVRALISVAVGAYYNVLGQDPDDSPHKRFHNTKAEHDRALDAFARALVDAQNGAIDLPTGEYDETVTSTGLEYAPGSWKVGRTDAPGEAPAPPEATAEDLSPITWRAPEANDSFVAGEL